MPKWVSRPLTGYVSCRAWAVKQKQTCRKTWENLSIDHCREKKIINWKAYACCKNSNIHFAFDIICYCSFRSFELRIQSSFLRKLSVRYVSRKCIIIEFRQLLQFELRTLSWINASRFSRCLPENEIDVLNPRRQSTTLFHFIGAVEQINKARFRLKRDQHRETSFVEFNSFVAFSHQSL